MRHRKSRATTPTSTLHQPLSRSMNVLSICAGYGGIDLGLRLAVPAARTVCWVEREAAACEILVRRMSEGWLDPAPIWSDATTFDGKPWNGVVDCIAAGIPCQPWSTAGKRKGFEDERHLGEHLVRTVGEVGPGLVFVENVPGFVRQGLPDLLGRLANLGYDAQWGMFSAAGVGAPHRRQRVFLLAHRNSGGLEGERFSGLLDGERRQERDARDSAWAFPTPFPPGPSSGLWERVEPRAWPAVDDSSSGKHKGIKEASRKLGESFARQPSAGSLGRKPQSEIEPGFCRVAHGAPSRVDRLRMLGNGVVPLAAAHAFRTLSSRIHP
jgi:DNA (cytosine-5)-methyltransferase 1